MQVKDLMSTNVISADKNDTLSDVAKIMKKYNVGCVPVTEGDEKVLGLITDRDIVINMSKHKDIEKVAVTKVMSDNVYSVQPNAEVEHVLDLMKKQQIRRVPVIENDVLIGMLSIGDIAEKDAEYKIEISDTLTEISKSNTKRK